MSSLERKMRRRNRASSKPKYTDLPSDHQKLVRVLVQQFVSETRLCLPGMSEEATVDAAIELIDKDFLRIEGEMLGDGLRYKIVPNDTRA